jgi:FtsP/CotA-like multicopper oxidase with cupredoxin domain
VQLGDRTFGGLLYNGAYVPPTLRARLGDTLRITFRNNLIDHSQLDYSGYLSPICTGTDHPLDCPSNLHFHA